MLAGDPLLDTDTQFARLAASFNLATSSTTLQNVTGLSIAVVANATYVGYANLAALGASNTEDVKYAFNAPAGASLDSSWLGPDTTITGGTGATMTVWHRGNDTSFPTPAIGFGATSGGNTATLVRLVLITGANAGTLQLQAAQNTSGANITSIVVGSHIVLWRVA